MVLPRVECGAENQNKETEKDQGVHDARGPVFQNLVLQENFLENHLDSFLHVVQAHFRLAHGFPHQPAAVDAEGHDGQSDGREGKKDNLERRQGNVPENLAAFSTYIKCMFFH